MGIVLDVIVKSESQFQNFSECLPIGRTAFGELSIFHFPPPSVAEVTESDLWPLRS